MIQNQEMKLSGESTGQIILLASIIDRLSLSGWAENQRRAKRGATAESRFCELMSERNRTTVYKTGEDFEKLERN